MTKSHYRTIWISDTHLGTRVSQAAQLFDFLDATTCDTLYLVGDIIDGWALRRAWFWSPATDAVVHAILDKAADGTRVIYVPGNHDEFARDYVGHTVAGVTIEAEAVHVTADGRRLLILHGDKLDVVTRYARWLACLGDRAYEFLLWLNRHYNTWRRWAGRPYWSLSSYVKHRVKDAVNFISDFEEALAREARSHGFDGVVCGHIHRAEIRDIGGVLYCNDGDWVESCTALVEHGCGRLELIHWAERPTSVRSSPRQRRQLGDHVVAALA